MIILYGIPNCATVKKARAWLDQRGIVHTFHDLKKHGIETRQLASWSEAAGWETLLNRKGTTWRKLGEVAQARVVDSGSAQALMLVNTSIIKRPVVEWGGQITVGFDAAAWLAAALPSDYRTLHPETGLNP